MGEVRTEFTSDIKRLEKAYDELDKRNRKLADQLASLKDKSKESNQTHQSGLEGTIGSLAKMATGYLSVSTAIGVVTAAERERQEMQSKSLQTQMTTADAQIKALRNYGVASKAELDKFSAEIGKISKQTGMSQTNLYLAASTALSAKGNLPTKTAMDAVRMAATVAPESGDEATQIAGALLDLAKVTGTSDTKQNLGFLLGIGQKARVTNLSALSANLVPGIIGVQGYGGEVKDAGALLAAITAGSGDAMGAQSKTAAISFAEQLEAFLPKENRYTYDTSGRKKLARKGTGIESTAERIEYLRQNEEARNQFLANMTMEKASKVPVRDILLGGVTGDIYDSFRKEMATGERAASIAEQTIAGIQGVPLQQTATSVRGRGTFRESLRLADSPGAIKADIQENLGEDLFNLGVGFLDRQILKAEYALDKGDPLEKFERLLANREQTLMGKGERGPRYGPVDPREGEWLELTREMLANVRGLREDMKTKLPATETHTE